MRAAADALERAGRELVETDIRLSEEATAAYFTAWVAYVAQLPVPVGRENDLQEVTRLLRRLGAAVVPADLSGEVALLDAAHNRVDVELGPGCSRPKLAIGELRRSDPVAAVAAQAEFAPFTIPANVEGRPSITVPVGLPADPGLWVPETLS